jgi:hypothetical protein
MPHIPEDANQTRSNVSPVDDHTYNLLQALTSTLESIEAYDRYGQDGGSEVFARLLQDEQEHAQLLLDELRTSLEAAPLAR